MHEHIDEMGIINMNGRIYDPLIGRFMSADPKIPNPRNLQSFNRYSYVRNNPLKLHDPSGFEDASYTDTGTSCAPPPPAPITNSPPTTSSGSPPTPPANTPPPAGSAGTQNPYPAATPPVDVPVNCKSSSCVVTIPGVGIAMTPIGPVPVVIPGPAISIPCPTLPSWPTLTDLGMAGVRIVFPGLGLVLNVNEANDAKPPKNPQPITNPPQAPEIPPDWIITPNPKRPGGIIATPPGETPGSTTGEHIRVDPPGSSPVPGLESGYWVNFRPGQGWYNPGAGTYGGTRGQTHIPTPPGYNIPRPNGYLGGHRLGGGWYNPSINTNDDIKGQIHIPLPP